MTEQSATANQTPTPADMPQQKAAEAQPEASGVETLPEWAQRELTEARKDAAKYRTRAKEFADDSVYERAKSALAELDKVEEASKSEAQRLTEEKEQLLFKHSTAVDELTRLRAAMKAGFSGEEAEDIVGRLRGEDEESMIEDARKLRELIRPTEKRADVSQGHVAGGGSPGEIFGAELSKRLR